MRAARVAIFTGLLAGLTAVGAAAASPGEDDLIDGAVFGGTTSPQLASITANPAALLRLPPALYAFVQGSGRLDRIAIDRARVDPGTGALSPGARVNDSVLSGGGVAGVVSTSINPAVGASFAWQPDQGTIARDGTAYQSRGDRGRRIDWINLAVAYPITSKLHVGLSITYGSQSQRLRFARDTALEAGSDPARGVASDCGGMACGFENPLARETWSVDVASNAFLSGLRYTLGAVFEVRPNLWIAASAERPWQLGAVTYDGTATVTAAPRDGGAVRTGAATLSIRAPVVWRLGVRGRFRSGWDGIGEVRLRRLDRVGAHEVHTLGGDLALGDVPEWYPRPRGLRDSYAAWAGAEQVDDGRTARFGVWVGADTGATDDARISATSPWGAELAGALGLQLRLAPRWVLQLGSQIRWQVPITAGGTAYDPRARVECVDSGYDRDLPACAVVRAGYGLPTAAGDYRRFSHLATVGLRIELL